MPKYLAHYTSLYVSREYAQMWAELQELSDSCGVSMNRLVMAALAICSEPFKENLPTKRTFIIESAKVVV